MLTFLYKQCFYLNEAHDNLPLPKQKWQCQIHTSKFLMSTLLRQRVSFSKENMYNFQPSLDQHETSGIFCAANPFDVYTLPVKININLMPALPTEHFFCRQE